MPGRILVIDDEKLIRWSLRERLTQEGYGVSEAEDGESARAVASGEQFDLVLLDLRLPDITGTELLKQLLEIQPDLAVIVITAYSSVESAVEALKSGAVDYITKPFNLDELSVIIRRVFDRVAMRRHEASRDLTSQPCAGLSGMVGKGARLTEVKALIRRAAQSEAPTVLLQGESGVGKDLAARAIHAESARARQPFLSIACSTVPDSTLEVELFGREQSPLPGAPMLSRGLLELAHQGTVYIKEIGDMSPALQAKLLRVMESKVVRRGGAAADIGVDTRIIAGTSRNLERELEAGAFREDLYRRLGAFPIYLPPLRECKDDLPYLIHHFFDQYTIEFHRSLTGIAPEAMAKMIDHDWPGNVRELRIVLERAILLCSEAVLRSEDIMLGRPHLGLAPHAEKFHVRLPDSGCRLRDVERDLVEQALERVHWNQTRAATLLGISRDQVRYKMEKFGIGKRDDASD